MTRLSIIVAILVSTAAVARAEITPNNISISTFNPDDAVAPVSTVEGAGVKVGEGTVLRPVFGVETGYVSNVFYTDKNPTGAGLLRLMGQIGVASLGQDRLSPSSTADSDNNTANLGELQYRANVRVSYDFMLSSDNQASSTGGLGLGASFRGMANPMGKVSFGWDEDYERLLRAANFETDANVNRDINMLHLLVLLHPESSSLAGFLYYDNRIDVFERGEFANRMWNTIGIHPMWKWLPHTQLYADASWGFVSILSQGSEVKKQTSAPLSLKAGIATLLSLKTTFNLDAGYTNGFYSGGPSFSAPQIGAELGYRYSPMGHVSIGYVLTYQDSINANYYRDHVIVATLQHLVVPFVVMLQPEIHFREYSGINATLPMLMGPDTRDDVIFSLIAGAHYNIRSWMAVTVNYRFTDVSTNYMYTGAGVTTNPSFVRHELLAGLRVAM